MNTAKPVQSGQSAELANYFDAIDLHMKVYYIYKHNQSQLNTKSSNSSIPETSPSSSNLQVPLDEVPLDVQQISDMIKLLDPLDEPKIETYIADMFLTGEFNNLLLALLQLLNQKLSMYNLIPTHHSDQMNFLIKWVEQMSCNLSDSKVSNQNLDVILYEANILIIAYPNSLYETSRDYRLLEAVREIVFKLVEYKGDPEIYFYLTKIDAEKDASGVIRYIKIALERERVIKLSNPPVQPNKLTLSRETKTDDKEVDKVSLEELLSNYKSIIPDGLKLSELNLVQENDPDQEMFMFEHFLNNLACTFDETQAKLALDYLNDNFDDIVSRFAKSVELLMDLAIGACTRQYHLFTTLYYPPNIGQPSCQSVQMLHSTTSLLKRIFTSTISLSSATSQTKSHLILLIFSLRLSWTSDFSVEGLTGLETSILANQSLDKSQMICICIRMLQNTHKMSQKTFDGIQRFALQMLTKLTMPLQFRIFTDISKQYDFNAILNEINECLLNFDDQVLQESFDQFLAKAELSERTDDTQSVIEHLIYEIVQQRRYFIYENLEALSSTKISTQLQRFIEKLLVRVSKVKSKVDPQEEEEEQIQHEEQREAVIAQSGEHEYILNQLDRIKRNLRIDFCGPKDFGKMELFSGILFKFLSYYDEFVQYPEVMADVIDTFTEACTCLLKYYHYSVRGPSKFRRDFVKMFSNVEALLNKMYGTQSALGHKLVTKQKLTQLFQDNIYFIISHCSLPQEVLDRDFSWNWTLHHSLVQYSRPQYLLSIVLEEFISFLKLAVLNMRSCRENYQLMRFLTSMLDVSVGKMFLNSNAIYKPGKSQFNLKLFFSQLDDVFNFYLTSYLEVERDYKILVLFKRVLSRLFELHGSLFFNVLFSNYTTQQRSESPVFAYFEQLIKQGGNTERVVKDVIKEEDGELNQAENEEKVLVKRVEALKVADNSLKPLTIEDEITYEDLIEDEEWEEYEEDDDDEFDDFELVSEFVPEFIPEQNPK